MQRLILLILLPVCLWACEEAETKKAAKAVVSIDTFTLAESEWDVGCYYALSRKDYDSGVLVLSNNAFSEPRMRINGIVTKFATDSTGRIYNDQYEVLVETKGTDSVDYSTIYKGKIKLKAKDGTVVAEQEVIGECGC